MRRMTIGLVALTLCAGTGMLTAAEPVDNKQPRVLILGIDGCRPDALAVARTPHLDALAADGLLFEGTDIREPDAQDKADTISGPGWSNLFTGVWPDKHNVLNNEFSEPHYDRYPHFFKRLKEVRPQAFTASFSDWKPIAEKIVTAADINRNFPEQGKSYEEGDAEAAAACVKLMKPQSPDATCLYLGQVDETGHRHGFHPTVPEYVQAIEQVDRHIGEVVAAIRGRTQYAQENWLVLVCTDHGGLGTGHGGGHEEPEIRRTFLIVSGPSALRGRSDDPTWQVDVVATTLHHLGVTPRPEWELDGKAVGLKSAQPAAN